ncbi:hypothetical protein CIPAW_10G120000 [Carya illinoinensis]|uniref:Uncharacterized protein n=1 Tax=Carya illinoinensis TaxID=32201 RepID=A0A8T1PAJ4_CARIL|nr:hypothetical protein CIPAW_10G120000 [Carya illinoinensis]
MRAASNLYISSSSISGVTIAFYSSSPISPCRNSYSEWVWRMDGVTTAWSPFLHYPFTGGGRNLQ